MFAPVKMDLVGNIKVTILACLYRDHTFGGSSAWDLIQKHLWLLSFIVKMKNIGQLWEKFLGRKKCFKNSILKLWDFNSSLSLLKILKQEHITLKHKEK